MDALFKILDIKVTLYCILKVLNFLALLIAYGLQHLCTMQVLRTVLRSKLPWQLLRIEISAKQTSCDRLYLRSLHEKFSSGFWIGLD